MTKAQNKPLTIFFSRANRCDCNSKYVLCIFNVWIYAIKVVGTLKDPPQIHDFVCVPQPSHVVFLSVCLINYIPNMKKRRGSETFFL